MDIKAAEEKLREFLVDDMLKDEVAEASNDDQLDLDSLDQTELRVFLEEEFSVTGLGTEEMDKPLTTITEILAVVTGVASKIAEPA